MIDKEQIKKRRLEVLLRTNHDNAKYLAMDMELEHRLRTTSLGQFVVGYCNEYAIERLFKGASIPISNRDQARGRFAAAQEIREIHQLYGVVA